MKISEYIYKSLPISTQNLLISIVGLKVRSDRYGANFRDCLNNLQKSQFFEQKNLRRIQEKRLKSLIKYSYEYVPYYNKIYNNLNIDPDKLELSNYNTSLPIIDKFIFRKNIELFYSRQPSLERKFISTSGTSGTPLKIGVTKKAIHYNYAYFERFMSWAGISYAEKSVTFAGRIFIGEKSYKNSYWRSNYFMNNLLMSTYHISNQTIPSYIEKLESYKPTYIDSYPSAIYEIAHYIVSNNIKPSFQPKAIITSSETLLSHQRICIEKAFNCRVFDQYGSAEMVIFAGECEAGKLHVNPEFGLFEIVDDYGNPVQPGEIGQLVCTGFINYATPLIRYKIGDSASLSNEKCCCGRNFPILAKIEGRNEDILLTRDGRKIGRLDPVFKGLSSIVEAQIIQENLDYVKILVVPEDFYNKPDLNSLKLELQKRLGTSIKIDTKFVERIPRSASGKFKAVISKLPSDPNI